MLKFSFRSLRDKTLPRAATRRTRVKAAATLPSVVDVLENRLLLAAALTGTTFEDLNGDGIQNADEAPLAGVTLYLDVNDNGVLDQIGNGGVEPDNFAHGTELTNVAPGVTLSTLDSNGNVSEDTPVIAVGGASNPDALFGHDSNFGAEDFLWQENFRSLRVDFDAPAESVSIDYISRGLGDRGRLQVFDADGNVLDTIFTAPDLARDQRATMTASTGNIAFAIATSVGSANGLLDSLSYTAPPAEPTSISDGNGQYTFSELAAGDYVVREVVPDGYQQTSPARGESRLFALSPGDRSIVEIDPQTGSVLNSFAAPGDSVSTISGLAYDAGTLFFVDANGDTLYELNPDTGAVRDAMNLDPIADARWDGVAAFKGEVYLNAPTGRIYVIDPATDALVRTIIFESGSNISPFGGLGEVEFGGRTVLTGLIGSSTGIVLLDPEDVDARFGDHLGLIHHDSVNMASDAGLTGIGAEIFVGFNDSAGTVQVLDANGNPQRTFQVGFAISGLGGSAGLGDGAHRVTLAEGETIANLDFGNHLMRGELRGTLFDDANGNGTPDADEAGLAGVTVYLDQNNNNALDLGEQWTQSDAAGDYVFRGLAVGEYIVRQITPNHQQQTSPVSTGTYYAYLYVVGGNGAMQIARIDPETGAVQRLGTPQNNSLERMHGLIRTNEGQFFGINGFNSTDSLFSVDLTTNQVTRIGSLTVNGVQTDAAFGLAYDTATDTLYGLLNDPADGLLKLAEIDRTSGAATVRGAGTNQLTATSGLAFDADRNVLVAFDNADDQFWQFDTDGTPTLLWDTEGLDGWGFAYIGEEFVLHARQVDNGDPTLFNRLMWRIDPYQGAINPEFFVAAERIPMESLDYYRVDGGHLVYLTNSQVLTGLDFGSQFINADPLAEDDTLATDEDTASTINVLSNDSDRDGDTVIITAVTQGTNGTVEINQDGTLNYTPNANYNGSDSFTYEVTDSFGGIATATVNVTVNAVNDAPIAVDDAYELDEDGVLPIAASGLLANDSEIDGDPLTATLISGPSHGTLNWTGDGGFTYTPHANYNGDDSFTYQISDGNGGFDFAAVSITVHPDSDLGLPILDVVPTDSSNSISTSKKFDVAILSTGEFDATTRIIISSLTFGKTGDENSLIRHKKTGEIQVRSEDVNGDGFLDLVVSVDRGKTGLEAGDTQSVLKGTYAEGGEFVLFDNVSISSKGGKGGGGNNGGGKGPKSSRDAFFAGVTNDEEWPF